LRVASPEETRLQAEQEKEEGLFKADAVNERGGGGGGGGRFIQSEEEEGPEGVPNASQQCGVDKALYVCQTLERGNFVKPSWYVCQTLVA